MLLWQDGGLVWYNGGLAIDEDLCDCVCGGESECCGGIIPDTMYAHVTGTGFGPCMGLGETLVITLTYDPVAGRWLGSGAVAGGSVLSLEWHCYIQPQNEQNPQNIKDRTFMRLDVSWDDDCEGSDTNVPDSGNDNEISCDTLTWTGYPPASSPGITVDVLSTP